MTRIGTGTGGERIETASRNNVYTVLAGVSCVVVLLAIVVLMTRGKELLGGSGVM